VLGGTGVFAVPDFRRLWSIGLLVSVARWLEMLVVGVIAFQLTGSALVVALMTLLRAAPMAFLGALFGVLADQMPRRAALLAVLAVQGAAMGGLALSALAGTLAVWQLALGCLLAGLGWATDNPVRRMLIGEAVGHARVGSAMSLDVVANNASRIAGPAVGGTLLAVFGPAAAFAVALLLYGVAIGVAARLESGQVAGAQRAQSVLGQMRDGFAAALRAPRLRAVLLVTVIFNMFGWPCVSMIPVIGQESLRLGAEGVGVLASMDGIGALIGAGLVAMVANPARFAAIYIGGSALYLCGMIGFALAPNASLAALALLLVGVGSAGFATMQATLVFLSAPVDLRGRAYGVLSTAIGTGLLGFLQLGVLAEWLGARAAVALIGFAGFMALVLTLPMWHALLRKE